MPDRLRVAMGTVYPYDESLIRGGIEAVAVYLTHALARHEELDLHVVSCNRTVRRDHTERRGPVTFHWLATPRGLTVLRSATVNVWRVRRAYRQIAPDLIHAQGFGEYAVAARPSDRLLLTVHGLEMLVDRMRHTRQHQGLAGRYRTWLGGWVARQSVRRARAIVSIAGGYVPRLLAPWLAGQAIYPICNPIADEFFRVEGAEAAEPEVLWAGNIAERKNLVGLVEAFALAVRQVPQARLIVIGAANEPDYLERTKEAIACHGLGERVRLLGRVEQPVLLGAYARAAVVAMASLEETAPMVIAQAMAAGKPVVAARVGGVPWLVEDGVTGYLADAGDVQGMARRMVELLRDGSLRQRMGRAARQAAEERFAAGRVAAETVRAYRELVGGKEA